MSDNEVFADPTEIRHVIGSAGTFSLHNVSGDVEIRGVDGDEVRVLASSSGGGSETLAAGCSTQRGRPAHPDWRTWALTPRPAVARRASISRSRCRAGPTSRSTASARTSSIAGLTGEQTFKTVSGDVQIDCHGGRISLVSVSGDVDLKSDLPITADLTTTSGDIEINAPASERPECQVGQRRHPDQGRLRGRTGAQRRVGQWRPDPSVADRPDARRQERNGHVGRRASKARPRRRIGAAQLPIAVRRRGVRVELCRDERSGDAINAGNATRATHASHASDAGSTRRGPRLRRELARDPPGARARRDRCRRGNSAARGSDQPWLTSTRSCASSRRAR